MTNQLLTTLDLAEALLRELPIVDGHRAEPDPEQKARATELLERLARETARAGLLGMDLASLRNYWTVIARHSGLSADEDPTIRRVLVALAALHNVRW